MLRLVVVRWATSSTASQVSSLAPTAPLVLCRLRRSPHRQFRRGRAMGCPHPLHLLLLRLSRDAPKGVL